MAKSDVVVSSSALSDRVQRLFLVAAGVAWIPARWGVMTTWDTTWLGLGYVGWNQLMLVPLTLLGAGSLWAARTRSTRQLRVGWAIVAAGFIAAWLGTVLEFVVGGGLRAGPPELAMAGWAVYLLGTVLAGLGATATAVLAGLDTVRPRRMTAALPLGLAGVSMLAWPVLMMSGAEAAGFVDQLVVGAAWALVGLMPDDRR
ncbi:hypothetical protein [Georgenia muralis]|uniref:Uncharacterized protein n=1 Tax=Georgenia muralis TaxID=154117 RepID=A0A3N4Z7G6_9MICO|nr:hypothetical protein [Georgenia muralis]RPF27796.1 hypothetical protein EDD32_2296 [Georgenia muralis]